MAIKARRGKSADESAMLNTVLDDFTGIMFLILSAGVRACANLLGPHDQLWAFPPHRLVFPQSWRLEV